VEVDVEVREHDIVDEGVSVGDAVGDNEMVGVDDTEFECECDSVCVGVNVNVCDDEGEGVDDTEGVHVHDDEQV
jgi:hypothetical protein